MRASKSTTLKAFAALILLSVLWGYNWVVMKYALLDAGPFQFGALRTFLGALCLMGTPPIWLRFLQATYQFMTKWCWP